MNQSQLVDAVKRYLHRDDLDAIIPYFIVFATSRLSRALKVPENETITTWTMATNPQALPADFMNLRSLTYNFNVRQVFVRAASLAKISDLANSNTNNSALFYAISGNRLLTTSPTRLDDYQLTYWASLPPIVGATDTNAVLDAYPTLYLYATLLEAYVYTQDKESFAQANAIYEKELSNINDFAARMRVGSSPAMG